MDIDMKILVDHIQEKPFHLHIEEPAESFPVLLQMQSADECVFIGPIVGDVDVLREFDHLRVSGRVKATVSLQCSRCVETYNTDIDSGFTIIFRKVTSQEGTDQEDEVELSEQDLVSSVYSGNEIDLTHDIEEQIAMEIPLKPLCNYNCKGLCLSCGSDLNKSTCDCTKEHTSFKFSALKNFKVNR
ncbi:MAG TPA: DUF177 domain-containing protein [Desulfuromonadaceae bacterium]|jgi:uncharacterized protein